MVSLIFGLLFSIQTFADPIFEVDLWPEEGRPEIAAAVPRLELRQAPATSSDVIALWSGATGALLTFDRTRYRTISPGRLVATAPAIIAGRDFGATAHVTRDDYYSRRFPPVQIEVAAGTAIEFLQYRAEGACFVRLAGRVIEARRCPASSSENRHEVEPLVEWWVEIVAENVRGWLLIEDSTVRVVGRKG